jgi:uncharacterized protein (TIRG00374 family)
MDRPADTAQAAEQTSKPSAWVRRIIPATIFGVVVYTALLFFGDLPAATAALREVPWSVIVAALLLSVGNFAVRFLRWWFYLVRLGFHVPVGDSILVFLSSFAMALTPAKAGEVLKSVMLKERYDFPNARTAPIVVAERVTDLAGLVLLSAAGCWDLKHGVALALVGAAMVVVLMLICAYRPLGELVLLVVDLLAPRIPLLQRKLPKVHEAYEVLWILHRAGSALLAMVLSTVAWGLQCWSLYIVAGAVSHMHLSLPASFFVYSAPLLAGTLAMLPGGLGLTEASMTVLLVQLGGPGASPSSAAAVTFIVRFCALWWAIGIGFAAMLLRRTLYPPR